MVGGRGKRKFNNPTCFFLIILFCELIFHWFFFYFEYLCITQLFSFPIEKKTEMFLKKLFICIHSANLWASLISVFALFMYIFKKYFISDVGSHNVGKINSHCSTCRQYNPLFQFLSFRGYLMDVGQVMNDLL